MLRKLKIIVTILLGICILPYNVEAETLYSIKLSGTRLYSDAFEVLKYVNQERAKVGASALVMDETQMEAAMLRAAECAISYSHTRPNGEKCFTALPTAKGTVSRSENINIGYGGPQGAVSSWMDSAAHKEAILRSDYKSTGIGVFMIDGYYYWAEFFSTETPKKASTKSNKNVTETISVKESIVNYLTLRSDYSKVAVGQNVQSEVCVYNYNRYIPIDASNYNWSPSNGTYASVNSNGLITGKKVGTQTVTASLKNTSKQYSLSVEVTGGVLLNRTNFPDEDFYSYVQSADRDDSGSITEDEYIYIRSISLSNRSDLKSIQGIELLPEVEQLIISGNSGIENLDINNLPNLSKLTVSSPSVRTIHVSNCPELVTISCGYNKGIENISVMNCSALTTLNAGFDQNLKQVTLTNLPNLNYLEVWGGIVNTVNVSTCPIISETVQKGVFSVVGNYYPERVHRKYEYNSNVFEAGIDMTIITSGNAKYKEGVSLTGTTTGGTGTGGTGSGSTGSAGDTGWKKIGGTWYLYSNGTRLTGWQKVGGTWYYLDSSGAMKTGWQRISNVWYYFKSSGAMATGWQKISNVWYYFKSSGAMVTGWQKISNVWYYFKPSGAMVTGWQKIGNVWYYFKPSGAMATGWQKVGNTWYYMNTSGFMLSGWQRIGGVWYYFDGNGAMLSSTSRRINGKTYYFDSSGKCLNP